MRDLDIKRNPGDTHLFLRSNYLNGHQPAANVLYNHLGTVDQVINTTQVSRDQTHCPRLETQHMGRYACRGALLHELQGHSITTSMRHALIAAAQFDNLARSAL